MIAPMDFDQTPEQPDDDGHTPPPSMFQGSFVLAKAACDQYSYLCILVNGVEIRFSDAELRGEFVFLSGIDSVTGPDGRPIDFAFGRGMEVRMSAIVAVVDQES